MGAKQKSDADYEVGFGKPPKHSQFKPGRSGNPSGRPKGRKNIRTVLEEALDEKVAIREGEKVRTVTSREAMVKSAVHRAMKTDKGLMSVMSLMARAGMFDADEDQTDDGLSPEDDAILLEYLGRNAKSTKGEGGA